MGEVLHADRWRLKGQPRIDPCLALFKAPELARMVKHVSFCPVEVCNAGQYMDTGSALRHAAEGAGWRVLDLPWVWDSFTHYGSLTLLQNGSLANTGGPDAVAYSAAYDARLERVRADLAKLDTELRADTEVVIARYQEPLDWRAGLTARGFKSTVYDKSGVPWDDHVDLPNVGREAHAYATHIALNYDRLPELTVFTQANPFDHVPDFLDAIRTPTCGFRALGPHRLVTGPDGDTCHGGLPIAATFERLTGTPFPGQAVFAPGAIFMAHRTLLRRYPRRWWEDLADELAQPRAQDHLPWTMERLWTRS
jgi:hypothetical protein